MPFIPGTL
ncbi:hypothetical protein VTL71DRAFT_10330 [Oculimacula yallundae]|uniref:Uncharacterized protein n=1 Tax=Oculimacula yallundae TaxID=86028 RepID=A0ABR4CUZ7_9HELO